MDDNAHAQSHEPHPIFQGLQPELPSRSEIRATERRARIVRATALGTMPLVVTGVVAAVAGAPLAADASPDTHQTPATPDNTEASTDVVSVTGALDHVVRDGESIQSIARLHNIPTAALLALNGLSWRTAIHPGQILVVSKERRGVLRTAEVAETEISQSPVLASGQRASSNGSVAEGDRVVVLTEEMRRNARTIIAVGREMNVPNFGIAIALATAMQESRLQNVNYGDRDSVGLFQQRPSSGWGSVSQILDTRFATRAFFGGPNSPTPGATRGLLDIAGWQTMSLTNAAQAVQISAFPNAYAQWEASAWNWLFELT